MMNSRQYRQRRARHRPYQIDSQASIEPFKPFVLRNHANSIDDAPRLLRFRCIDSLDLQSGTDDFVWVGSD